MLLEIFCLNSSGVEVGGGGREGWSFLLVHVVPGQVDNGHKVCYVYFTYTAVNLHIAVRVNIVRVKKMTHYNIS